jgi:hypothetical protein
MKTGMRNARLAAGAALVALIIGGCTTSGGMTGMSGRQDVALSGANEVPPVTTSATGTATVTIKDDRSVTVAVTTSGITPTASHIHEGAAGTNGPVIVPFEKTGDNTFASKPDAKLTEAQYASYKAGNLYVNVHSAKNPGGEIRGQIKPM